MDTGEEQGSIRVKVARTAINGLRGALTAVASDPDVVKRATATELVAAGLDIAIRETSNLDRLIDAGKNWVVT